MVGACDSGGQLHLPEVNRQENFKVGLLHFAAFVLGLALLLVAAASTCGKYAWVPPLPIATIGTLPTTRPEQKPPLSSPAERR